MGLGSRVLVFFWVLGPESWVLGAGVRELFFLGPWALELGLGSGFWVMGNGFLVLGAGSSLLTTQAS